MRRIGIGAAALVMMTAACTTRSVDTTSAPISIPESVGEAPDTTQGPPSSTAETNPGQTQPPATGSSPGSTLPEQSGDETTNLALENELPNTVPGRILVLDGQQRPAIIAPGSGAVSRLAADSTAITFSQPTWGPEGQAAWTETSSEDGAPSYEIAINTDSGPRSIGVPFPPYFYYWGPDGKTLAFLGAGADGQQLGVLDVAADTVEFIAQGSPYYFDWSPDGSRILANITGSELAYVDLAGNVEGIGFDLGLFQAPHWAADGESLAYVARLLGGISARNGGLLRAQTPMNSKLIVLDVADNTTTEIARFDGTASFAFDPTGDRIAFSVTDLSARAQLGVDFGPLWVADIGSGVDPTPVTGDSVLAFQWSPDGSRLLYAASAGPSEPDLEWRIWEDGVSSPIARFLPTATFATQYLAFWDQFSRSLSLWSPDSEWITYADRRSVPERIMVARADGTEEPVVLLPGSMSSWSTGSP